MVDHSGLIRTQLGMMTGDDKSEKSWNLALQYYGGVGAFCSMAETYGVRLEDLDKSLGPSSLPIIKPKRKSPGKKPSSANAPTDSMNESG